MQSHRAPVYYVDMCLRYTVSLEEAVSHAKELAARQKETGICIAALELAARTTLANGAFEESEDEIPAIVEEFFLEAGALQAQEGTAATIGGDVVATVSMLSDRLGAKASRVQSAAY